MRLQGRVLGPAHRGAPATGDGRRSFVLQTADGARHTIAVEAGVLARPLVLGERITVDGVPGAVPAAVPEELYRQAARVPGIDATRITRGAWPALRRSVPAAAGLAAAAGLVLIVGVVARPSWQRVVRDSAARTTCPASAKRETRLGPDGVLHRCRDAKGRLHGAFTLWGWSGELLERGNYYRGEREGIHDALVPELEHWVLRRTTFHRGRRHGPTYELVDPETRQLRRYHAEYVDGQLHGIERSWHDDGSPAFVGHYRCGTPCGRQTYWSSITEDGNPPYQRLVGGSALPDCDHVYAVCVLTKPEVARGLRHRSAAPGAAQAPDVGG